ncbi:MAG: YfhO family protein, partial [Chloroflexota bacterium]
PYAWGSPYDLPGGVGGYVGMLPLALALAAPFFRRDRRTWFWLLFALAALLLALGKYNPIYLVLYQLPFFNSLRIAGHFLWVYSFAVAMLAVITCDRILETAPQPGMISRRVGVVVLALAAVVAVEIVLTHQVSLRDWLTLWAWLPVPLALFSVGIVGGAWRREIPQALVAAAIVGFTIFDIIAFCAVYTQSKNGLMPLADFARAPQSLAALPTRPGESRILTLGAMVPPFAPAQESLFPDLSTLYGIESVKGTTGLMLRYARNYTDNFSPGMLNLTNARYLLLPRFPPDASGRVVSQPSDKFGLRLGTDKIELPAVPASAVQVESYIENAADTPDGTQVGGIVFFLDDGTAETMPLRVGIETANWAIEREPGRRMPPIATTFPIFSGASLRGHTFRARLDFSGGTRALVGIQLTADSRSDILRIEHIRGLDNQGGTTLLDYYLGASNHSTVYRNDLVTVIENSDALPRTFLTHAAQVLDDATTLARLRDYAFDPRQGALLAEGQALADRAPEQDEDESVQITLYQPERVQLNLTANRKAYLVLSDTWYPGWIARVDGKAAPVYRAYVTLRAVPVEAGTHTVEFEFRPTSFYQGAAISIATLLCLVIGVGWALK